MTVSVELQNGLVERVRKEAEKRGVEIDECVRRLLDETLPERGHGMSSAIRKWIEEGDEDEQKSTFEAIREGLNQNHSSYRKMFP